jgi:hypothetical protein
MFARIYAIAVLCGLCLPVLATPAPATQAVADDCSYLVAGHSYANTFAGFMNTQKYAGFTAGDQQQWGLLPDAGAGVTTFYTGGLVKNIESILVGEFGVFSKVNLSGTYSLKWDTSKTPVLCSGTVHMTGTAGGMPMVDDFQIVVASDGDRVEMIHTNAGLIVQTVAHPAEQRSCRNNILRGTYLYSTTGWALAPLFGVDPTTPEGSAQTLAGYITGAMTGAMHFSPDAAPSGEYDHVPAAGAGAVTAWDTLSVNGGVDDGKGNYVPLYRQMQGWYQVNPSDCSGTLVLRDNIGSPEFLISFYVGKDGNAIHAVNVNNFADFGGPSIPIFLFPIPMERASRLLTSGR